MVDALGAQARPFLEQSPAPEDDGDVLMITVGAALRDRVRRRERVHAGG
jgi:hypothetical protein